MRTTIPQLLALVVATAIGFGLSLALFPPKTPPEEAAGPAAPVPATVVVADPPEAGKSDELAGQIFEGYHERVFNEFVNRSGFSYLRTLPHPGFQFHETSVFTRYDFTFIGNDPTIRRYKVADPMLEDRPLVFSFQEALATAGGDLRKDSDGLTIENYFKGFLKEPGKLFDDDLIPDVSLPTEGELDLLARFEASPEKTVELHPVAGGTLGYGAVRAAETCLECHKKERGDLLGLFRYRFDHGNFSPLQDLVFR